LGYVSTEYAPLMYPDHETSPVRAELGAHSWDSWGLRDQRYRTETAQPAPARSGSAYAG